MIATTMRTKATRMTTKIPVKCYGCGATGEVLRVTAGLQCRCGSTDIDLYDEMPKTAEWDGGLSTEKSPEARYMSEHGAKPTLSSWYNQGWAHGHQGLPVSEGRYTNGDYLRGHDAGTVAARQRQAASPGTGWNKPHPDPRANWDEYAGPTPGYSPRMLEQNDHGDTHVCPACNGTGHDSRASGGGYDETSCRYCHGTGRVAYPTEGDIPAQDAHTPVGPPLGAGNHGHYTSSMIYPTGTFTSSNLGTPGNYTITYTPSTYTPTLSSTWTVTKPPTNKPVVVPGKKKNKVVTSSHSEKLMKMAASIVEHNPGLTTQEAFELARRAVTAFPEDGDK